MLQLEYSVITADSLLHMQQLISVSDTAEAVLLALQCCRAVQTNIAIKHRNSDQRLHRETHADTWLYDKVLVTLLACTVNTLNE
jgi:hypothetical protein